MTAPTVLAYLYLHCQQVAPSGAEKMPAQQSLVVPPSQLLQAPKKLQGGKAAGPMGQAERAPHQARKQTLKR